MTPMKRTNILRASCAVALLTFLPISVSAQGTLRATAGTASGFNSTVTIAAGDLAAASLSEILKIYESSHTTDIVIVTYEREVGTLDVEVIDKVSGADTEWARNRLREIIPLIEGPHISFVKRQLGINVSTNDYRVSYYAGGFDNMLLKWERGQFVIP